MTRHSPNPRKAYLYKLNDITRERLENLSELENRSMAQIIEIAVEFYQNHKSDKGQHPPTEPA